MQLQEDNLTIRSAGTGDAELLCKWWNDGTVMAHAGFPEGLHTTAQEIRKSLAEDDDAVRRRHMIEIDGVPAGEMVYRNLGNHTAEIGIKICDAEKQGRGYGTRLLRMFIDGVFFKLGYEKIVLDTNLNNLRAQHVYEKLGFQKVRVRKNAFVDQLGGKQTAVDYELKRENRTALRLYQESVAYLLDWYESNARILPWRQKPEPYYVWISEIMLQQTRVEAVKGYFERFLEALPTVEALASVEEDRLFKLWEGLGYYTRARNLKKAAERMTEQYGGNVPADYDALLDLPGVGSYTAGAIASIAFGIAQPAVDGNVLRVMKRISGSFDDITKGSVKKELEQEIRLIMPKDRPGDYNQSLMELGATVCIPNGRPLCDQCPVMHLCRAFHNDTWKMIPVKSASKKEKKIIDRTIFVLKMGDRYAIRKRQEKGLLSGLWELPGTDGLLPLTGAEEFLKKQGFPVEKIEFIGEANHIFSHIVWHMNGYLAEIGKENRAECERQSDAAPSAEAYQKEGNAGAVRSLVMEKERYGREEDRSEGDGEKTADGTSGGQEIPDEEPDSGLKPEPGFQDLIFADRNRIAGQYSLPSAFEAYKSRIFAEGGLPSSDQF